MASEEPLFDDVTLPTGWHRKVVQRQSGATAGQWDVYLYNADGKKFRSRNELRSYLTQNESQQLNLEDFDFSVKGKGHQNKGKSPIKKESSPPPTVSTERPKRELRKKLNTEEIEEIIESEPEELLEDEGDLPEISSIKLKVKVGYTATGALIRPATNDRKNKRRFRNMTVKKKPKTIPIS